MPRQAGSHSRSYQATYSSTMARVAGCVVTSSTRPSPRTQTRRPSSRAARYSAPVLIAFSALSSLLGKPPAQCLAGAERDERIRILADNLRHRKGLTPQGYPSFIDRQPVKFGAVQRGEGLEAVEGIFFLEDLGVDFERAWRSKDAGTP